MTIPLQETNQTRINAEIRQLRARLDALFDGTDIFVPSGGSIEISGGLLPLMQFFRLNAALAGVNTNTTQNIFGVGCTLEASTVYAFQLSLALTKTAGTTSHTISLGWGGTATLNNINYHSLHNQASVAAGAAGVVNSLFTSTAALTVHSNAIATAAAEWRSRICGTVSVNAAGTFIPQYDLSAPPGGAYSTELGSYMLIYPLGTSGADTNVGTWA